jgi:hypothetical protein
MKRFKLVPTIILLALVFSGIVSPSSAQDKPAEFTIARAVVGTGVENLEPVGSAETFSPTTEKVYCFIEATSIATDTEITFVWYYGDKELLKFNTALKAGPKWRTYAHKNLYGHKGDWRVEIKDSAGKVLKEIKFKVE